MLSIKSTSTTGNHNNYLVIMHRSFFRSSSSSSSSSVVARRYLSSSSSSSRNLSTLFFAASSNNNNNYSRRPRDENDERERERSWGSSSSTTKNNQNKNKRRPSYNNQKQNDRNSSDFDSSASWGLGLRNAAAQRQRRRENGGPISTDDNNENSNNTNTNNNDLMKMLNTLAKENNGKSSSEPPPAPAGWKPGIREDMKNDFDAIRAATFIAPRSTYNNNNNNNNNNNKQRSSTSSSTSSSSSSSSRTNFNEIDDYNNNNNNDEKEEDYYGGTNNIKKKNTATSRFKENRGKGGDEERKRLFQQQLSLKTEEPILRRRQQSQQLFPPSSTTADDDYQKKNKHGVVSSVDDDFDGEEVRERKPVPKGMSRFFVTCHPGLEEVVAKELSSKEIRASNVEIGASGVSFFGNLQTAYNANIWLRSGTRVLCELASADLDPDQSGFDSVYNFVKFCCPWEEVLINADLTFSIESRIWSNSQISSTKLACTRAKDAICDYISDACDGIRPRDPRDFRGNKIKADVPLFMTLYKDRATLYRDTSGDSLHRRGYRANLSVHKAALNEAAAAGLLHIAGWPDALEEWRTERNEKDVPPPVFIDPMCGSGTMVVEAALMAMNVAPGLVRYRNGGYAFQNWPDFNEGVFLACIKNAEKRRIEEEEFNTFSDQKNKVTCLGNDIHPGSVSLAQRSALAAGVPHVVKVYQSSVDEWNVPPSLLKSRSKSICTNPPWGKRISLDSRASDVDNSNNYAAAGAGDNNYDDEENYMTNDEILPGDINAADAGDAWRKLGVFLKREMPNESAFVLSGDPSVSREIFMRASRKHVLGIGGVDCRLLRYDILPPKPKET